VQAEQHPVAVPLPDTDLYVPPGKHTPGTTVSGLHASVGTTVVAVRALPFGAKLPSATAAASQSTWHRHDGPLMATATQGLQMRPVST